MDDEPQAVREMADFFRKKGIETISMSDPREALEIIKHFDSLSGLITDLKMPSVDGYEMIAVARERALVFVAAITGHATQADENKAYASGCTHFFQKPLNLRNILRSMNAALPQLRPAALQ